MKLELLPSKEDKYLEDIAKYSGKIYFGVPEDTSKRTKKSKINNAQILAIMEHGSPVKNIPPRQLLNPVVMKHKDKIMEYFNQIYDKLISGDKEGADNLMNILSQRMERWAKAYFVEENGWAPNSPSTIKRKGSDRPLIDTGALRSSIRGIFAKK